MLNESLKKSVIQTLAFFDLGNFPLTKEELYGYLWRYPPADRNHFFADLNISAGFSARDGFYFLPGREEIMEARRRSLLWSEKKMFKAKRAARLISSVPFLRAVFVCNSVAFEQTKEDGDIDFFIVAAPGRIWLVRFFANLILRLLGLRTFGRHRRDRICLSFIVTENNLDLSALRATEEDIYLAYWLATLVPLYDPQNFGAKIWAANKWARDFMQNFQPSGAYINRVVLSRPERFWQEVWQKMWRGAYGDLLESQVKKIMMTRLPAKLKVLISDPAHKVVLSDEVLKFHENDRRLEFFRQWRGKLISLGY